MNVLDGCYDGGGDGTEDYFDWETRPGQDYDGGDDYMANNDPEFPVSEYGEFESDADNFESNQLGLDQDIDYGYDE